MIRFTLKCDQSHSFESWFANGDTFETLNGAGHVQCSICGSNKVQKAIMTPNIASSRNKAPTKGELSTPKSEVEATIAAMRERVEKNSEYVGMSFAQEARSIHEGEKPERAIYGEAKPEEAKKLLEDGVPVVPLPFTPARKAN